jgi:hypothetical protein
MVGGITADEATQIARSYVIGQGWQFRQWVRTVLIEYEGGASYAVVFEYPDADQPICPSTFTVYVPLDGKDPWINPGL